MMPVLAIFSQFSLLHLLIILFCLSINWKKKKKIIIIPYSAKSSRNNCPSNNCYSDPKHKSTEVDYKENSPQHLRCKLQCRCLGHSSPFDGIPAGQNGSLQMFYNIDSLVSASPTALQFLIFPENVTFHHSIQRSVHCTNSQLVCV